MENRAVILFDGVCNLCNSAVQFVIKHDKENHFKFASIQSDAGQRLLNQYHLPQHDINSFVLIENATAFTRSTAALKVSKLLNGPVKLLYGFIIVPAFIRDAVYTFIANNRYRWFGQRKECMIPTPELKDKFIN
jgi:predicted DCC family thiol-disulfide oxidoreductase YuxK